MKKHRVSEGLREPMSARGFRYQASRFIADRDPYTLSVGINTASEQQGRVLALNPVLGVAHKGAVAWLAGATGRRDWLDRAIVSRPIGYVMPEDRFTQWRFTDDNLGEVAVAVADAVATHGLPWMEHMTDLDAMRIELATGLSHGVEVKMPVVLALLGHRDEARSFVEAKLEEFDGQTHLLAEYYRGFAAMFLGDPPPTDASGQDADRGDEPG